MRNKGSDGMHTSYYGTAGYDAKYVINKDGISAKAGGEASLAEGGPEKTLIVGSKDNYIAVGGYGKVLNVEGNVGLQINNSKMGVGGNLEANAGKIEMPIEINIGDVNISIKPSIGIVGAAWGRGIYLDPKTGKFKSSSIKGGEGFTFGLDIEIK